MKITTPLDQFAGSRRSLLLFAGGLLLATHLPARAAAPFVEVWKASGCGCCEDWVAHLQASGFKVKVNEGGNDAMRERMKIDRKFASCHTAVVGGYALEGHVPAREINRLLKEKPNAVGLAVPGMPVGSPGMDGPAYGGRKDAYSVMLLARNGGASIYQSYPAPRA